VEEGAAVSDDFVYVLVILTLYVALMWGVYEAAVFLVGY
jgi:hypothetical protein